ncbi:hypothetical protein QFC24_004190 [Naganishia onofrii]|uniref:Uncharacterized protein n=1 Tax=Naganishia onofrii TaxID=1851511 RepID=A0ACC2XH97_9TREE|nr:hypothetical protein QFC24_004190 [Naganishia onofrii]
MNPFASMDKDEEASFPPSNIDPPSSSHGHRKGLTSGSDPDPDGLPPRIGSSTMATSRNSASDDDAAVSGEDHYEDSEPPESLLFDLAAESAANASPERLSDGRSVADDSTPADSDIPTIDPESTAATAEQSMYTSYRPSTSGNSQPVQNGSTSTVKTDNKKRANLGSSSMTASSDQSRRAGRQQGIDKPASNRKGKGKADLDNKIVESMDLASSDGRNQADRGRTSDADHPINHALSRANSASPPPDLLLSSSSSDSSIGLSTRPYQNIPRDAAAEKRNLLPLPVTTPHPTSANRMGSSSLTGQRGDSSSVPDVTVGADGERRKEKKRPSTKSRTERHRHRHAKRPHKHSRAIEHEEDDRRENDEQYSDNDGFDDDQRAILMSSPSNRNESRTGTRKRSKKRVDPMAGLSERDKALWVWANVTDLDGYLQESDIQTISWGEVVIRIGRIRQENALTSDRNQENGSLAELQNVPKLDAHDVANRIMRQENYLIALFTKDLLDLRVRLPLPSVMKRYIPQKFLTCGPNGESVYLTFGANSLTKALEWNLRYCLLGFIFDERGRVRKGFVKDRGRQGMIESFFRYFEEYHKNPSAIGSRGYTPFARWKFREFNELPHVFERRLDESYPAAKQYVDQFPKEITAISMRFVAFISGAFAAVLLLLSVVDPVFLHFEITPDRTVLFYLGVFTSILAVSRGMIPANNQVFDPELLLTEVVGYVHYMPESWEGKLHSQQVHAEFSKMFQMKLAIFAQEIASVILTPLVLLFSLPSCAGKVIDFCREFTVHVNGIGYVCSFAVFNFKREGNVKVDQVEGSTDTYGASRLIDRESKMEQSFLHFKITNPEWQPSDAATSLLLSRIADGDAKAAVTLRNSSRSRRGLLRLGNSTSPRLSSLANESLFAVTEDERLKQKSLLYETALQRNNVLKGTNVPGVKATTTTTSTRNPRLQPMEERPEAEEEDGWETAQLGVMPRDGDMQGSANEADHGDGMLGLLHQVIKK